jgi:hypothetical protein
MLCRIFPSSPFEVPCAKAGESSGRCAAASEKSLMLNETTCLAPGAPVCLTRTVIVTGWIRFDGPALVNRLLQTKAVHFISLGRGSEVAPVLGPRAIPFRGASPQANGGRSSLFLVCRQIRGTRQSLRKGRPTSPPPWRDTMQDQGSQSWRG